MLAAAVKASLTQQRPCMHMSACSTATQMDSKRPAMPGRWLGDAVAVTARAKTVVKVRTDAESGEPVGVRIPDHLDILVSPFRHRASSSTLVACMQLSESPQCSLRNEAGECTASRQRWPLERKHTSSLAVS